MMNSSSSKRIHFLSEQLANQIAAGEVVERPASVLKELLENALDAGATQVDVEVEKGGMVSMVVRDNGHGIHADDMALAISRHATSKIDSLADLEALFSLGFRGEALASIGSVSRMKLSSRTMESEHAWSIEAQGRGSVAQEFPATHPIGSSIEVRELFFNTPARRKFLRSEKTEFNHLEDVFKRAALSRPQVGFTLTHNQRQVHRYRARCAEEQIQRVTDVCGKAFAVELEAVDESLDEVSLRGWVSASREGRSSTDLQYFFLNGRMVRDKLIQHAIRQAYETMLPAGRHAAYVLYMELTASEVDVNVHPTKHEVRFQQSRKIHDFIVVALRRHLPVQVEQDSQALASEGQQVAELGGATYSLRKPVFASEHGQARYAAHVPNYAPPQPSQFTDGNRSSADEQRILTIIGGRFVLLQSNEHVRVLDSFYADQLLVKHELSALDATSSISSPLIFPVQIDLSTSQLALLESLHDVFARLGIIWEQVDEQRVRINAAPQILQQLDLQAWLQDILNRFVSDSATSKALITLMATAAMGKRRYLLNQTELGIVLRQLKEVVYGKDEHKALWLTLDSAALTRLMNLSP
ncbi:MAG: DNA mismatch repair endonuclease MutL [Gammaproteobacteria bacterium]|nr:DNA mismatch repair endonuclease MutL [Gammaproteobacteria bacterium]